MKTLELLAAIWTRAETCPDAAQIIRAVVSENQRRQVVASPAPIKAMRMLP
jgi:hypothetical protein